MQQETQFNSITVVRATTRFKSRWPSNRTQASAIPTTESAKKINAAGPEEAQERTRQNPKTPNFGITPLSKIENSVDASTCAFSNQEKQGQSGTLTPNPQ